MEGANLAIAACTFRIFNLCLSVLISEYCQGEIFVSDKSILLSINAMLTVADIILQHYIFPIIFFNIKDRCNFCNSARITNLE